MKTILDEIVAFKIIEIEKAKELVSIDQLKKEKLYSRECISMSERLRNRDSSGIIAEFKRKSPSRGWIHQDAKVSEVVSAYQDAGVSAISCLTDQHFFGGTKEDFTSARASFDGPILRKDFIIDPYQIHESKAMGADTILLIASILDKEKVVEFTDLAHELGLEVLLELHHNSELDKYYEHVDMVGINNRDLRDFSVSLLTSIDMKRRLPDHVLKISESGLDHPGIVSDLHAYGFEGFLMGEYFMKDDNPGKTAAEFVTELQVRKSKRRA